MRTKGNEKKREERKWDVYGKDRVGGKIGKQEKRGLMERESQEKDRNFDGFESV